VLPELTAADGDEGGDRRGEHDRVVGVDDALHVAEHQAGADQPAAPEQHSGPGAVSARRTPGEPQSGDQGDQRCGQQPGISLPISLPNSRVSPVAPPKLEPPSSRPKPL